VKLTKRPKHDLRGIDEDEHLVSASNFCIVCMEKSCNTFQFFASESFSTKGNQLKFALTSEALGLSLTIKDCILLATTTIDYKTAGEEPPRQWDAHATGARKQCCHLAACLFA